jgi:hypothetical protein
LRALGFGSAPWARLRLTCRFGVRVVKERRVFGPALEI